MILSPSPSLQPTLERLSELAKLPADWDADGSPPPSSIAIAEACRLLVAALDEQRVDVRALRAQLVVDAC